MRGIAVVGAAVAGLGLLGSGLHGMTGVDARLSDADDRPAAVSERVIRQEIRAPGDCPWRDRREEPATRYEREL